MHVSEPKRLIMRALEHGPLDEWAIAADTGLAPFHVRADLKGMRRDQLVTALHAGPRLRYELTTRGYAALYEPDQLRLIG